MPILSLVMDNERMKNIRKEFSRLGDKCYLDNAGAALYPESLLKRINEDLLNNVYMNPHSDVYTKDCIEQIRYLVLKHFNTDTNDYSLIFTSGATQSLKIVLESFQFYDENDKDDQSNCGSYVYLRDNHTSVLGLREIAKEKDVDVVHISRDDFLDSLKTKDNFINGSKEKGGGNTLFVYPAQSNFNGYKYPINCINNIKNGCLNSHLKKQLCNVDCNWYVMLDIASLVATSKLDLSITQPDFLCFSFYKIFGYPTGLGALLVKNSSANILSQKKYFGGGTVDIVLSSEDFHEKRKNLHERFEDGTIPFLSVLTLKHCFDVLYNFFPKSINIDVMDIISHHTFYLAKDLYKQLLNLKHKNGVKAIEFYMDSDFNDIQKQGGILTLNIIRDDSTFIGYSEFQKMAELFNIFIRTGCFCNAGTCQRHLKLSNKQVKAIYKAGHKCGDDIDLVGGQPIGAIRVSFGYYNTLEDVDKMVSMITQCFVRNQMTYKPERKIINLERNVKLPKEELIFPSKIFKTIEIVSQISENKFDITLSEIAIFPIKSCGAFKPKAWKIGNKGFEFDREWMIVRENGVCLTQKQNTQMCMIHPIINIKEKCMVLNFKDKTPVKVPLDPVANSKYKETSLCQSKVCTDVIKGYDCGDEVADWISEALGISFLRLIKQSEGHERVRKKNSIEKQTLLSLSNQAQFLLINKATVCWLKDRIQDPLFEDDIPSLVDRFRGNLIIDMEEELIECKWKFVVINGHQFKVEEQCSRCQMVCIDQKTGQKTIEPLRTISKEFEGKLKFGIYLSYLGPTNTHKDSHLRINTQVSVKM